MGWTNLRWITVSGLLLGCSPNTNSAGSSEGEGEDAESTATSEGGTDEEGTAASEGSSGAAACEDPETMVLWAADGELTDPMGLSVADGLGGIEVARSWSAELGTLSLSFSTACEGPVYLWAFVWDSVGGQDMDNADSHYVAIDGLDERPWLYGCNTPADATEGRWAWIALDAWTDQACEHTVLELELPAGEHTVVFRNREAGMGINVASIAAVVVSHDPLADPTVYLEPPSGG